MPRLLPPDTVIDWVALKIGCSDLRINYGDLLFMFQIFLLGVFWAIK
jgi:hypothetical protein